MTILSNGTVIPHGILGAQGHESAISAFNRSFKNTGIKAGFITKSYPVNDVNNVLKLCTEYDVQTIEQNENKGSTSILYSNCLSSQGFGGIGDFLEYTLRPQTYQSKNAPVFDGQDGAIVLIQCLDNIGSKAIVIGNLIHPDRTTNISTEAPRLSGEYNGVNIEIQNDGSCSLTFKGATDSKGNPTDPSQGNTVFQIKADGSFQFNHSTVTIQADRGGTLTINAKVDANITAGGNVNVNVSGDTHLTTAGKTVVKSKEIDLNGDAGDPGRGVLTSNSSYGVVDFITGIPLDPSITTFGDV